MDTSWADTATTDPWQVNKPDLSEDAKQKRIATMKSYSPDPDSIDSSVGLANAVAPKLGMKPGFVATNANQIVQALDGKKATPKGFLQKIETTSDAGELRRKKDQLAGELMMAKPGYDAVALSRQYQDVKAKLEAIKPEDQLGGFGSFLVNTVEGLGYQVGHAAGTIGADAAGFMMGELWDKALHFEPNTHLLQLGADEASKVFGTLCGQTYGDLIDKGIDPKVARGVAAGMGVFNVAAWAIPGGKTPGVQKLLEEATTEGVLKATLAGAVIKDIGKGIAKQTGYGAINSTVQTINPYVAEAIQKRESLFKAMGADTGEIMKEIGVGTAEQVALAGGMETIGAVAHGVKMAKAIDQARAEVDAHPEVLPKAENQAMAASPEQEEASAMSPAAAAAAEAQAEAQRTALAKQVVAAMPASELDTPIVSRETERINDLATLEKNKVITEPQQSELDKLRTAQAKTPSIMAQVDKNKGVQGIRKLLAADPENPGLKGALATAEDQAAKDALEKQAVVNEKVRIQAIDERNRYLEGIHRPDPSRMNKDLGDAVRAIQDKFEQKGHTLKADMGADKVAELAQVHEALQSAGNETSPDIDLARLKDLPTTKLRDLTIGDIKTIHDAVLNLDHIQRMRDKVGKVGQEIERSKLQEEAKTRIAPPKISKLGPATSKRNRLIRAHSNAIAYSYSSNGEWIFGGKNNPLHDKAIRDPLQDKVEVEPFAHDLEEPARAVLRDKMGIDQRNNPLKWTDYWTKPITADGVTLTRGEVMDNYMDFQSEDNRTALLEGGSAVKSHVLDDGNPAPVEKISESTYQKLFAQLSPEDHELMDAVAKQIDVAGDHLDQYNQRRHGFPLPREENYWPKYVVKHDLSYNDDIEAIQKANRQIPIGPSEARLTKRIGSKSALHTTGFWDKFHESVSNTALITKMGESVKAASDILFDPVISDKIERSYGKPMLTQMRADLAAEAGQGEIQHSLEKALDTMGNIAGNLRLGIVSSATVPFKMLSLGDRSWSYGSPKSIAESLVDLAIHPRKTALRARLMSNRLDTATRKGATLDQAQMLQNTGKLGKARAVLSQVQRANMALTRATSLQSYVMDTNLAEHEANRQFERAEAGKPFSDNFKSATGLKEEDVKNLTPEQKFEAAGKYADTIIGETHATNDPGHMIGLQKSAIGRNIFGKFQTESLKGGEQIRRTLMQAYRKPTVGNISRAAFTVSLYGLMEGAVFYGLDKAKELLFGAPKNKKAEPTRGDEERKANLAMVPIAGPMVENLIDRQKFPNSPQYGATEGVAMMPLETVLNIVRSMDPELTERQRQSASKKIWYDLKQVLNVPLKLFGDKP